MDRVGLEDNLGVSFVVLLDDASGKGASRVVPIVSVHNIFCQPPQLLDHAGIAKTAIGASEDPPFGLHLEIVIRPKLQNPVC